MSDNPKTIDELLDAIQVESLKLLLERIEDKTANATEIATAIKIAREYGMTDAWRKAANGDNEIPGLEKAVLDAIPKNFGTSEDDYTD